MGLGQRLQWVGWSLLAVVEVYMDVHVCMCIYIYIVCVSGVSPWSSIHLPGYGGEGRWDAVSCPLSAPLPFPGCCLMLALGAITRDPCLLAFPLFLPAWLRLIPFPTSSRLRVPSPSSPGDRHPPPHAA